MWYVNVCRAQSTKHHFLAKDKHQFAIVLILIFPAGHIVIKSTRARRTQLTDRGYVAPDLVFVGCIKSVLMRGSANINTAIPADHSLTEHRKSTCISSGHRQHQRMRAGKAYSTPYYESTQKQSLGSVHIGLPTSTFWGQCALEV